MERKRDGLDSIGEFFRGPSRLLKKALRSASPQPHHYFTQADQVNQLVGASEADPDMGFMVRLMALCSMPRTNPGDRKEYVRRNGPYTLGMSAGINNKLPYGNIPRMLLAWVCTEAVRTQSRELVLGDSVAEFMRKLGIYSTSGEKYTRLRNQMQRLFNVHVQLIYEDEHGEASVNSLVADRTELWWNPKRLTERSLWESKIELGEKFFNEIIRHPVPLDMNILKRIKRSSLGLDFYLWLTYRTFSLKRPTAALLGEPLPPVRSGPGQSERQRNGTELPQEVPPGAQEDQDGLAFSTLRHGQRGADHSPLAALDPAGPTAPHGITLQNGPISARVSRLPFRIAADGQPVPPNRSWGFWWPIHSVKHNHYAAFRPGVFHNTTVDRGSFPRLFGTH